MATGTKTRNVMTEFVMEELSGVDSPAQVGARKTLLKRAEKEDELDDKDSDSLATEDDEDTEKTPEKGKRLDKFQRPKATSETLGHAHIIDLADGKAGNTSWADATGDDSDFAGHSHAWIEEEDGTLRILPNNGHTHDVMQKAKTKTTGDAEGVDGEDDNETEDPNMATTAGKTTDSKDDAATKISELEKSLAKSQALASMNDATKAHFNALDEAAQVAFLTKSEAERAVDLEKAAGDNAVIYTDLTGNEYTKRDDVRVVASAQRADSLQKQLAATEKARETDALHKRASAELGSLPGTVEARADLLKAVDSITDEAARTAVTDLLKAANGSTAMGSAFTRQGAGGGTADASDALTKSTAESKLEALSKSYAEANKVDIVKARVAVLDTVEGDALYRQTL